MMGTNYARVVITPERRVIIEALYTVDLRDSPTAWGNRIYEECIKILQSKLSNTLEEKDIASGWPVWPPPHRTNYSREEPNDLGTVFCEYCEGSGFNREYTSKCDRCGGTGRVY